MQHVLLNSGPAVSDGPVGGGGAMGSASALALELLDATRGVVTGGGEGAGLTLISAFM